MLASDASFSTLSLSTEKIIEIIRDVRNGIVKDFMAEEMLNDYFLNQFGKALSAVKREFIRRDLRELCNAPLDLVHYSKLITSVKQTGVFVVEENIEIFNKDVDRIFSKYFV